MAWVALIQKEIDTKTLTQTTDRNAWKAVIAGVHRNLAEKCRQIYIYRKIGKLPFDFIFVAKLVLALPLAIPNLAT